MYWYVSISMSGFSSAIRSTSINLKNMRISFAVVESKPCRLVHLLQEHDANHEHAVALLHIGLARRRQKNLKGVFLMKKNLRNSFIRVNYKLGCFFNVTDVRN